MGGTDLLSGAIAALRAEPAQKLRAPVSTEEAALRQVLARELHDRVGQTLTTMLVELENFKVDQAGSESVLRHVDAFQGSTREVLNSLRALLYELRGEMGVEDTLVSSLGTLVARFQEKTTIATNLTVLAGWPEVLKSSAALNVYRIVEEALANVRLHSGAQAARVVLGVHSDTELAVLVSDDGRGVDTHVSRPLGLGMMGMRERALILGGQVLFESQDGVGTTVRATFPRTGVTAEETA